MKLKTSPVIHTKRLILRAMEEKDRESALDLFTNEEVGKTYMLPAFQAREEANPLFEKIMGLSALETRFVYGISLNGKLIGLLNDVEIADGRIELGYAVHPDFKGKGYATEALMAGLDVLFKAGISVVETGAFEENLASIRVMEKSGMTRIDKEDSIEYRGKTHRCVYYQKRAQNPSKE